MCMCILRPWVSQHWRAPLAQGPTMTFFKMNQRWVAFMLRLWGFLPAGTRCHSTIWSASKQQGFRLASSAICKVQRLCEKLEQLQSRVVCPRLTSFTERGEVYQLPVKAAMPRAAPPLRKELEYLAGFFDGDGSVSLKNRHGVMQLQINQNVDSARVLLRFRAGVWWQHLSLRTWYWAQKDGAEMAPVSC